MGKEEWYWGEQAKLTAQKFQQIVRECPHAREQVIQVFTDANWSGLRGSNDMDQIVTLVLANRELHRARRSGKTEGIEEWVVNAATALGSMMENRNSTMSEDEDKVFGARLARLIGKHPEMTDKIVGAIDFEAISRNEMDDPQYSDVGSALNPLGTVNRLVKESAFGAALKTTMEDQILAAAEVIKRRRAEATTPTVE